MALNCDDEFLSVRECKESSPLRSRGNLGVRRSWTMIGEQLESSILEESLAGHP